MVIYLNVIYNKKIHKRGLFKLKQKIMSMVLCAVMFFTFSSIGFAANENTKDVANLEVEVQKEKIQKTLEKLQDSRAKKLLEQEKKNRVGVQELESNETSLENDLKVLGVKKLSQKEVKEHFSDPDVITAQTIVPPSTSAINWYAYNYTYYKNNVSYAVMDLYAQGLNGNSNLAVGANGAVLYSNKEILVKNITNIASMYVQKAIGQIPVVSWLPYEFLFSNNTNVTNNSHVITHRSLSTVCFNYVKLTGQSDDYLDLTFRSNMITVASSHTLAGYNNGSPYSKTTDRTQTTYADNYSSAAYAVNAYISYAYNPSRSYIDSYSFYNPDRSKSIKYYVVTPEFPAQIN